MEEVCRISEVGSELSPLDIHTKDFEGFSWKQDWMYGVKRMLWR
jgi:hypothetical protein